METDPGSWRGLVERYSGSVALAAHELARMRLAARGYVAPVPSEVEVWSAALEIHSRARLLPPPPTKIGTVSECRCAGLPVV